MKQPDSRGPAPYDSIQMSRRLNNGRPTQEVFDQNLFNNLQVNFRNGKYITSNLMDNL